MQIIKSTAASAWRWHVSLFAPPSASYRYWFRVTFLWFVPICTIHQLAMSAFFDVGGLTQRIVISRVVLALVVGAIFSLGGWLASSTVQAARKLI
jgi:hypothetical protein